LLAEKALDTSARGTTRGWSTEKVRPSYTIVAVPFASTFFSQSAVVPYGRATANPSSVRTARTGVS
jgi:hypothetical protein